MGGGRFLSLWRDERSAAAVATALWRLIELRAWLGGAAWLDMLLADIKASVRRAGMILANAMAEISGLEPATEPITLATYRSRARIEVQGEDEGEMFRISVPLRSLPGCPREGDRYKLVVSDLWHHWFGIAAAKKTGWAISRLLRISTSELTSQSYDRLMPTAYRAATAFLSRRRPSRRVCRGQPKFSLTKPSARKSAPLDTATPESSKKRAGLGTAKSLASIQAK